MNIISTSTSHFTNLACYQVFCNIVVFGEAEDITALNLENQFLNFKARVEAYDQMLIQSRSSNITHQLEILDEQRKNLVKGLIRIAESYTKFPKIDINEAATRILNVIHSYGYHIDTLPYADESAAISNIVEDLKKPENSSAISALFLDLWMAELESINNKFMELYNTRTEEHANYVKGGVKNSREEANSAFKDFCTAIDANAYLNGDTAYAHLISNINSEIEKAQNEANRRGPRASDDENLDI